MYVTKRVSAMVTTYYKLTHHYIQWMFRFLEAFGAAIKRELAFEMLLLLCEDKVGYQTALLVRERICLPHCSWQGL